MGDHYGNFTVMELDDEDCPQYDDFGHEIDELRPIKQEIEEMKNSMSEVIRRAEIQGSVLQEMRRRLAEAESKSQSQEQIIRDLSEQLNTARAAVSPVSATNRLEEDRTDQEDNQSQDSENLNAAILRRVLRLEEKGKIQDDMECKRSLLISNLGIENVDLMRQNHYPRIRDFLRRAEIGFLLDVGVTRVTNVRLYNSGAIKIRYAEEWMAHHQFKRITDFLRM